MMRIYLRLLASIICVYSFSFQQINDKTMVSVEDLQMPQGACECTRDAATLNKGEEHLRLLLRVSSVRLISALQNLAHQANAEIDFLVQRTKHKLYEKIETEFPRLLSQMSVSDSIEELIHRLRNQLFISTDLSPRHIEKEMEKAVQNFFMQIMPPTFLCITTGPCRSVTQSYANCLRNNSPSWKTFYGNRPNEMAAKLRRAILKYRVIEKTIDKLHMSVIDIETINISCIARFTAVVYCGLQCSQLEGSGSPVGYCSESCTNAVHSCLGESAKDWDSFVTILRKLSVEFDHGFVELERGIISSLSYALGVQAPAIAKIILKKCGPINPTKSAPSNTTLEYAKPPAVQKKLVGMIRKFTSYIGWWQRLAQNVCGDASRISACWNGSALISRAEINSKPESALKAKPGAASPPVRVMDQNEGSGSPVDWSDDEDIASDGSGSGDGEPPVQPVSTVTQLVPVTPPPPPPPALTKPTVTERPAIRMVSPTKPPAIVSPQPTTKLAQRNLPLSLLVLFLVALCTLVSYF